MNSLYNWVLLNGVILMNVVISFIETVCDKVDIVMKALADSNTPSVLIFRNRNEVPVFVKDSLHVLKGVRLSYSIDDKKFYGVDETTGSGQGPEVHTMGDVVLAELVAANGTGVCNMSHFFHSVRWTVAPSLREFVLVNMLQEKIIASDVYLNECVLNVVTLSNPSLNIKLSSATVNEPFVSWSQYDADAPPAELDETASASAASAALPNRVLDTPAITESFEQI